MGRRDDLAAYMADLIPLDKTFGEFMEAGDPWTKVPVEVMVNHSPIVVCDIFLRAGRLQGERAAAQERARIVEEGEDGA